jgi:hypothetical protein
LTLKGDDDGVSKDFTKQKHNKNNYDTYNNNIKRIDRNQAWWDYISRLAPDCGGCCSVVTFVCVCPRLTHGPTGSVVAVIVCVCPRLTHGPTGSVVAVICVGRACVGVCANLGGHGYPGAGLCACVCAWVCLSSCGRVCVC